MPCCRAPLLLLHSLLLLLLLLAEAAEAFSRSIVMPPPSTAVLLERLGPRLASVFNLVPRTASVVADIGCDHNSLGLSLALDEAGRRPKLRHVIGIDRAEAPIAEARRTLERLQGAALWVRPDGGDEEAGTRTGNGNDIAVSVNGRRTVVELRLGDGLEALAPADGVDTLCMAGIGTRTIVEEVLSPSRAATKEVLRGVRHIVVQAYDPRPLFMRDLRFHLAHTLREQGLGPGGQGYVIKEESIVRAERRRLFISVEAQARLDDDDGDDDKGGGAPGSVSRDLLLGRHLRAKEEGEERALYLEYVLHHRDWLAQLAAARKDATERDDPLSDAVAQALVVLEAELEDLGARRGGAGGN